MEIINVSLLVVGNMGLPHQGVGSKVKKRVPYAS